MPRAMRRVYKNDVGAEVRRAINIGIKGRQADRAEGCPAARRYYRCISRRIISLEGEGPSSRRAHDVRAA